MNLIKHALVDVAFDWNLFSNVFYPTCYLDLVQIIALCCDNRNANKK